MLSSSPRGKRLLRRYPILAPVPEEERPAMVRAALRHPAVLVLVIGGGLLLLPPYFDWAFALLRIEGEPDFFMKIAKLAATVLAPLCIAVPLLSRGLIPVFIRREMQKRGYETAPPEPRKEPKFKSRKK